MYDGQRELVEPVEHDQKLPKPHDLEGDRSCRDVFCCLLFVVFFLVWLLYFIQFSFGRTTHVLTAPADEFGFICGDRDLEFDYFFNGTKPAYATAEFFKERSVLFYYVTNTGFDLGKSRCVATCPENGTYTTSHADYSKIMYPDDTEAIVVASDTSVMMGRCIPSMTGLTGDDAKNTTSLLEKIGDNPVTFVIEDFQNGWLVCLLGVVLCVVLSLIWIYFLRCCAGLLVYTTVFGLLGVLIFSSYYYFMKGREAKLNPIDNTAGSYAQNVSYVLIGITVIYALLLIFLFSRIALAISVIEVTSRAVSDMWSVLLVPFFFFIIASLWVLLWFYSMLMLASDPAGVYYEDGRRMWDKIPSKTYIFVGINFFALFWLLFFIIALGELTIAGAVADWYFVRDPRPEVRASIPSPVYRSLKRAVKYNLGSLAFGSLIVAILCWVKWFLRVMEKKLRSEGNQKMANVAKCAACCAAYIEKVMKYINRNAYIYIAITPEGASFLGGAIGAVKLIMNNLARAGTINFVGDFLLFIGKLFISLVSALFAGMLLIQMNSPKIHYWIVLATITFVICYFLSSLFLGVFEMAIDTIFLSFLKDSEECKDDEERMYAPEELRDFYKKKKEEKDSKSTSE